MPPAEQYPSNFRREWSEDQLRELIRSEILEDYRQRNLRAFANELDLMDVFPGWDVWNGGGPHTPEGETHDDDTSGGGSGHPGA